MGSVVSREVCPLGSMVAFPEKPEKERMVAQTDKTRESGSRLVYGEGSVKGRYGSFTGLLSPAHHRLA